MQSIEPPPTRGRLHKRPISHRVPLRKTSSGDDSAHPENHHAHHARRPAHRYKCDGCSGNRRHLERQDRPIQQLRRQYVSSAAIEELGAGRHRCEEGRHWSPTRPPFTTAENQATEQAQQIQNLVLQGYKAIVINAASPTALNGAVKQACSAGVVVVSFDGIVTEPCAYRIAADFHQMGAVQVDFLAKKLGGKGNILEVRGSPAYRWTTRFISGIVDEIKKYPGMKIVGLGLWRMDADRRAEGSGGRTAVLAADRCAS